jgi:hypothetical protein
MAYTITLPEELYLRAERYAKFTGRDVDDIVASVLENGLPLPDRDFPDFATISDSEVLKLTKITMNPARSELQSQLLYEQQAGTLTRSAKRELDELMDEYRYTLLIHAYANAEAVKRGLMPKSKP